MSLIYNKKVKATDVDTQEKQIDYKEEEEGKIDKIYIKEEKTKIKHNEFNGKIFKMALIQI
jgi:hypothetical protein